MKKTLFVLSLLLTPGLFAQGGLDPADALKPLGDQWTSYSGDYSGKRYSSLKQITAANVKNLSLDWLQTGITSGCGATGVAVAGAGGGGGFGGGGGGGSRGTGGAPGVNGG